MKFFLKLHFIQGFKFIKIVFTLYFLNNLISKFFPLLNVTDLSLINSKSFLFKFFKKLSSLLKLLMFIMDPGLSIVGVFL